MNTKDWNRKQVEKKKEQLVTRKPAEKKPELDMSAYPLGYHPGDWVTIEQARAIERYHLKHDSTGDSMGRGWVNKNGDRVAFSY